MRRLGVVVVSIAWAGCRAASVVPSDAAVWDLSPPDIASLAGDGGAVSAAIAFAGCAEVGEERGLPRCEGPVPLTLRLVPVAPPGATDWLWTIAGGSPDRSKAVAPEVRFDTPGRYRVALVVGGASGTASAEAIVDAAAGPVGAACAEDVQCAAGLTCLCGRRDSDGGVACPPALARGVCTRACMGGGCGIGEVCVDLSRSIAGDVAAAMDAWRAPLCAAGCSTEADCPSGLVCRELPVLSAGASVGGAYTWKRACFAPVLAEVGASCSDADGRPAPTTCVGGVCPALGGKNLCTSACDAAACPTSAACATFTSRVPGAVCLSRCDAGHPCGDPFLACQVADAKGGWGFRVGMGEAVDATYCGPKRCRSGADCPAGGSCVLVEGSSFCLR